MHQERVARRRQRALRASGGERFGCQGIRSPNRLELSAPAGAASGGERFGAQKAQKPSTPSAHTSSASGAMHSKAQGCLEAWYTRVLEPLQPRVLEPLQPRVLKPLVRVCIEGAAPAVGQWPHLGALHAALEVHEGALLLRVRGAREHHVCPQRAPVAVVPLHPGKKERGSENIARQGPQLTKG